MLFKKGKYLNLEIFGKYYLEYYLFKHFNWSFFGKDGNGYALVINLVVYN